MHNLILVSYPDPRDVVSPGVVIRTGRSPPFRCPHSIMVVLTDEQTGQFPQSRHVEGFEHLDPEEPQNSSFSIPSPIPRSHSKAIPSLIPRSSLVRFPKLVGFSESHTQVLPTALSSIKCVQHK